MQKTGSQRGLALLILPSVLLFFLQSISAAAQPEWNIMTEELPPYNFIRDGEVYGISADVLLQIMAAEDIDIVRSDFRLFPWPRAYKMVQETPGSILFSTARTATREKLFKWVGPITHLTIGLTALKERHIRLQSLEDAAKYRLGTIRDGAPEQLVLKAGVDVAGLDRIGDPELNIKKLQAGRIDMFAFNIPSTRYLMIRLGIDPDRYETVYIMEQLDLYYAFHRDTDDALIRSLNATLQALRQPDGTGTSEVERIISSYLGK
jgi:ABC-type amino acid transport substrate-binding protein